MHSTSSFRISASVEGYTASASEREGSAGRYVLLTCDETQRRAMSSDEIFSLNRLNVGLNNRQDSLGKKKKKRRITQFSPVFLGQGSRVCPPLCIQSISSFDSNV